MLKVMSRIHACTSNQSEWEPQEPIERRRGLSLGAPASVVWCPPDRSYRLRAKLWPWVGREELMLVTTDLIQEPRVFHLGISPTKHSWKVWEHSKYRWWKSKQEVGMPGDQGICGIPPRAALFLWFPACPLVVVTRWPTGCHLGKKMTKECMYKSYFKY